MAYFSGHLDDEWDRSGKMAAITGTNGADFLDGTNEADVIDGLADDDVIRGRGGDDVLHGGDGDDTLLGGDGRDELYGGDGNDRLFSRGDSYFFETDRVLSGGAGDDILSFQPGNMGLVGELPMTLIDGGSGIDTFSILAGGPMVIDLSDVSSPQTFYSYVNNTSERSWGITLVDVERLEFRSSGGSYGNDITGGALDDTLSGGRSSSDILRGGGGDDILSGGGGGRDTLLGGSGDDHLSLDLNDILIDGGDGIDTIFFSGYYPASQTMIFSLEDPSAEQTLLGATVRNVERIGAYSYGTRGDDVVTGGDYDDVFDGWNGNDIIRGGGGDDVLGGDLPGPGLGDGEVYGFPGDDQVYGDAGSDVINGHRGDDLLFGGEGDDWLSGDEGDDVLDGGEGADELSGGSGADIFVFAPGDLGFSFATRDKIHDYEMGLDQLDLTAFADATITISNEGNYARVKFDFDGDHRTDALIQVATLGGGTLTMDDLLL